MNRRIAAIRRGGVAVFACMALALISAQVHAQTCNGNPKAKIDPDSQTVAESIAGAPTVVQLNGSKSTPNNATLLWQQIQVPAPSPPLPAPPPAPAVTLSSTTAAIPTFTAPSVGPTVLRFRLTVTCGTRTDSTTTDINVTDVVTNAPPTAVATASPASAHEGTLVTLDGSASYDIDPGTTLSFNWVQTGVGPSIPLSSADPPGSIVTFVAPNTPVATGAVLTFRLTVSDGSLTGTTDQAVNIVWSNDPPVASLVCPADGVFIVDEGGPVTLDGSGSSDADGSIVGYSWSQAVGLPNLDIAGLITPSISFNAPSLGYQQFGGVTLTLTVTDDIGATSDAVCSVWIKDVTPPIIHVPGDTTIEADFAGGKAFSYSVMAFDAVDNQEPYELACAPPSGSDFPLAEAPGNQKTTVVSCSTVDSAGNSASASFDVTVEDTTPPEMTLPLSFAIEAVGPGGAIGNFAATSWDAVDGAGDADCSPASGGLFAIETVVVTCNATDSRGNTAAGATFELTVHDTTAPEIGAHGDEVAEATGPGGATVGYALPSVSDAVSTNLVASCLPAPGSTFALGSHTVTCNASDAAGNPATATSFQVTVQDTTAPVISYLGDISAIAVSNSVSVVEYPQPTAHDLVDGAVIVSCSPASGSTFGVGTTAVECTTRDRRDNVATGSFNVQVSYAFTGFFRPVDNVPTFNTVKAGSAVPLKFSLGGDQGMSILAAGFPKSGPIQCDATEGDAVEETVLAGSSSLQYDPGTDQYIYVWKTEKNWSGCRILQLKLGDGSTKSALFKFR